MTTLLVIVWVSACILLTLHWSVRIARTRHSQFELKRRNDKETLRRENLTNDLDALRETIVAIMAVIITALAILLWQWWGVAIAIIVLIAMRVASRLRLIRNIAQRIHNSYEPKVLNVLEKYSFIKIFAGSVPLTLHDQKIESIEQLMHLIETSGSVLTQDQEAIIKHGIDWHTTEIGTIMTKAKDIISIKHSELLGPLVLDDLHRTGHNRFPVIRGNIDAVVGMLDISQLLDMSVGKRSETAEKVMSDQVLRIESDEMLPVALDMLQRSHLHMLIVVDGEGKTVGLVTLADITSSLLGKNRGGVV
jgi:CBS domain containing-hemolysin-like protein